MYKTTWDKILEKVRNGATLLVTYNGGHLVDLIDIFGFESCGLMTNTSHNVEIDGEIIHYADKEIIIEPKGCEVLYKNEEGNPVLTKNKYGKGTVYFANFDVEGNVFMQTDGFNKDAYYLIYRTVAKEIIEAKPIICEDRNLGITINPENDNSILASVLNYSDHEIKPEIKVTDGYEISDVLYGDINVIPGCDGAIVRIKKKH